MNINISQQISATYARNHFKEVTERAIKEGICVIMRKSKPVTVVLSIDEFQKITQKRSVQKKSSKISLKELREDNFLNDYVGCMKNDFPGLSSVEISKKWTDYVD